MYELEKQKLTKDLINFIQTDDLISLARSVASGLEILEDNKAIELPFLVHDNKRIFRQFADYIYKLSRNSKEKEL